MGGIIGALIIGALAGFMAGKIMKGAKADPVIDEQKGKRYIEGKLITKVDINDKLAVQKRITNLRTYISKAKRKKNQKLADKHTKELEELEKYV